MRRTTPLLGLCALLVGCGAWSDFVAGGSVEIDARYGYVDGEMGRDGAEHLGSVGASARGLAAPAPIQWGFGLDWRAGFSVPGGFLYELTLMPVGLGAIIGTSTALAVRVGVGFDGVTTRVPIAWRFPLEARLDFDIGDHVRVTAASWVAWTEGSEARAGGSEHAPFGDELGATLLLRIGKRFESGSRSATGNGMFFGFRFEERMGAEIYTVVIGHGLDMSWVGDGRGREPRPVPRGR